MKMVFHLLQQPKLAPKASLTIHIYPRAALDLLPAGDIDNSSVWNQSSQYLSAPSWPKKEIPSATEQMEQSFGYVLLTTHVLLTPKPEQNWGVLFSAWIHL